jgi:hypothetical protein
MKINAQSKSITFNTKNTSADGVPTMFLQRIGSSTSSAVYLDYIGRKGDAVTFRVDPSKLRAGRYHANAKFGKCCCLSTEVFIDGCSLEAASITSTPSAACGSC